MKLKVTDFGKFKLFKKIAVGGMAEIFLGCTGSVKSAHKFIIIKRILPTHSNNKEFNKMFQNEGKIVTNLNHSNIGSIYEFGLEKDQYFICMEYISGCNLRQLIKKLTSQKMRLSVEKCIHIIRNICWGLDHAHNCTDSVTGQPLNIIHRDISPQNIMISFNGDVKVIDFGIAKMSDSEATRAGVLKGKFEYMSPEQVGGEVLDKRTDIFSIGNILWELLAGQKLFTASTEIKLMKKIKLCNIPDLKRINPNVPDKVIEIVNRALHVNSNLRYQTVVEMANDLSVFLNTEYPNFTQNQFSSFIRAIYMEEILEEREKLKMYSEALAETYAASRFLRNSSINYSVAEDESSSFIGHREDLEKKHEKTQNPSKIQEEETYELIHDEKEETKTEAEQIYRSFTDHMQYTETEADLSEQSEELTKTKFTDELISHSVGSEIKSLSKSLYDNVVVTGLDPLRKIIPLTRRSQIGKTNSSLIIDRGMGKKATKSKKRKGRAKKIFPIAIASIFLASIGFSAFFFRSDIRHYLSEKIGAWAEKQSPAESPKKSKVAVAQPKRPGAIVNHRPARGSLQGPPTPTRSIATPATRKIFIATKPSGAMIYLNDKKVPYLTPTVIQLPQNQVVTLMLRKRNYRDKVVTVDSRQVKAKMEFSLVKQRKTKRKPRIVIGY